MVGQDQPPAGAQHPDHFVDRDVEGWDGAQAERAHHRVEGRIGKRQRVRGALPQRHVAAEVLGGGSGEVEHPLAEIKASQADFVGVERQVEPGSDGDFQDLTDGLRAGPLAGVTEESAILERVDLVLDAPHQRGALRRSVEARRSTPTSTDVPPAA